MSDDSSFLKQIKTIIEESRKQGTNLDIDRTLDSSSYILSNAKKSRAVIVGRVVVSGNSIVVAYVIDINKWNCNLEKKAFSLYLTDKYEFHTFVCGC